MVVLIALALLVRGWSDGRALRPLAPVPPPADAPSVVAIVPARDEAHQIGRCLRSLLGQDWPNLRVVCVDDRSTAGTGEIARAIAAEDPRLTVVVGAELPEGWIGKNFANEQGVRAAHAPAWYLFTDADTVHAPQALSTAHAAAARAKAGLFSILTDLELQTFWEKTLLTNVIASIASAFSLTSVNDPKAKIAIANGQYLMMRREVYEAVGGHAAIRDRVADDLELARLVKGAGLGLRVENGRGLVSVRMYTSLREIWWGFVKNASAGAGGPLLAGLGAIFLVATLLPFGVLPWAIAVGDWKIAALAGAGVLASWAQRWQLYGVLFASSRLYALLVPVSQTMMAGILVHSAVRQILGRGPIWKGREYPRGR